MVGVVAAGGDWLVLGGVEGGDHGGGGCAVRVKNE